MSTDLKVTDLNAYQRREIKALTDKGWTVVRVRRLHDDLNPWATVDMRSPSGDEYPTACPVSKRETEAMTA